MRAGLWGAQENNCLFFYLFLDTTIEPAAWIQDWPRGMTAWGFFFHPLSCWVCTLDCNKERVGWTRQQADEFLYISAAQDKHSGTFYPL